MSKVFITGISGTGKTAIAKALKERGINAIDMDEDDLCYWMNNEDGKKVDYEAELNKEFIDSHVWICDIKKLKNMLAEGVTVMLGHPENVDEILSLFDKFILLQCPPDIFMKRILKREDNDYGKHEAAQQHILNTYKKFENDVLGKGAISISVEGSLDEAVGKVIEELKK